MAATGPFGVIGVDDAVLERPQGVVDKAGLVQGIGMDRHLHIVLFSHTQTAVDAGRCGTPVLMQLEATGTGIQLFTQRFGATGVALAEKAQIHRHLVSGLQHFAQIPGPRCTGGCLGTGGRARSTADHGGHARHQRLFHLLRADEVDMGINATGRQNTAFARDHFSPRANDDIDTILNIGVARLANAVNTSCLDPHIRLDDAPVVQNQGVGDHQIQRGFVGHLTLAHAVADHLATAEFHFVAVGGVVLFDLNPELGVAQSYPITHGGAEHLGIAVSIHFGHQLSPSATVSSGPITSPRKP